MASSYSNIVLFLLTTLFYYLILKPPLTLSQKSNLDEYKDYVKNNHFYQLMYLLTVIIVQFVMNAKNISDTCGGNITENMGAAGLLTFFPWLLIFGVLIIILVIYPGFKSAFADVIGYFYVASSANKILTELLVNKDLNNVMNDSKVETPSPSPTPKMIGGASTNEEKKLEEAADAIVKICGNTSILINQIVPSNFDEYWNILNPLMKKQYQTDTEETIKKKSELFELVITRDNVGEAMWYIYTGILVTSIVQLKIATRGCKSNTATMQKNYQTYLKQQEEAKSKQDQATSTVYTITD